MITWLGTRHNPIYLSGTLVQKVKMQVCYVVPSLVRVLDCTEFYSVEKFFIKKFFFLDWVQVLLTKDGDLGTSL